MTCMQASFPLAVPLCVSAECGRHGSVGSTLRAYMDAIYIGDSRAIQAVCLLLQVADTYYIGNMLSTAAPIQLRVEMSRYWVEGGVRLSENAQDVWW